MPNLGNVLFFCKNILVSVMQYQDASPTIACKYVVRLAFSYARFRNYCFHVCLLALSYACGCLSLAFLSIYCSRALCSMMPSTIEVAVSLFHIFVCKQSNVSVRVGNKCCF